MWSWDRGKGGGSRGSGGRWLLSGVAGGLGLINVELASAEGVGLARSGSVLIAAVIGGTATFFGPVLGAVVLTFFSVAVASVSPAWVAYLGLFFVWVVVVAPK